MVAQVEERSATESKVLVSNPIRNSSWRLALTYFDFVFVLFHLDQLLLLLLGGVHELVVPEAHEVRFCAWSIKSPFY